MKKILMMIFLISVIGVCSIAYGASVEVPEDIRIGLYYNSSAKDSFTLSSPGGITIGVMKDGKFIYEDETLEDEEITISKGTKPGSISIPGYGMIGSTSEYPYFKSNEKDGISLMIIDGKKYRGNIEVRRLDDSDMTVINHVSMQEYLYGVVPREIGGSSPLEAVKAQAIVARTYAAKNYGKRSKLGFDLMPTVDDQAYGGYEWENKNSNNAVDLTNGLVVTYDGELIGGFYFSTSGGYTEDVQNVWGGKYDYLRAVPDTYEPNVEGNTTWEVEMTSDEVKKSLSKNGIDVGEILDLVPIEYTDAGRILTLKIVGTKGEETITRSAVRSYLGLKSQWYSINSSAPVVGKVGEPNDVSDDSTVVESKSDDNTDWFLKYEDEGNASKKEDNEWYLRTSSESGEEASAVQTETISSSHFDNYSFDESKYTITETSQDEFIEVKEDDKSENIVIENTKSNVPQEKTSTHISTKGRPVLKAFISVFDGTLVSQIFNLNTYSNTSQKYKYQAGKSNQVFVFRGRGWGHAVGMSQNGAKGMANNGFSAEEIIKWYYSGVTIER